MMMKNCVASGITAGLFLLISWFPHSTAAAANHVELDKWYQSSVVDIPEVATYRIEIRIRKKADPVPMPSPPPPKEYFVRVKVFAGPPKTLTNPNPVQNIRLHDDEENGEPLTGTLIQGTHDEPTMVSINGEFDLVPVVGAPTGSRDKLPSFGILFFDSQAATPNPRFIGKAIRPIVKEWHHQSASASSGTGGMGGTGGTGSTGGMGGGTTTTQPITSAADPCAEDPDDMPLFDL